jgi:hypothetical protein
MSDSLSKAKRFRERADECTRMAELATSDRVRDHYKKLAATYLAMVRAELTHAEAITSKKHFES